jgi:putative protease
VFPFSESFFETSFLKLSYDHPMERKIELLAPGGDVESVKAAIVAGADAIYLGLYTFNARMRATNIELDDLAGIVTLAHRNSCEIFITINIVIVESEIRALINLLNKLVNTKIDGVIVQDLGLLYLLSTYFKNLKIHASTQLTTHNQGQIKFLSKLSAMRVNLSRELNLDELKTLTRVGHENNILSEVFVHGSNCLSFSGLCYISSVLEGKSANRGRCNQSCREQYVTTPEGKDFPLNLKDNSAFNDLKALSDAGVDSVKIEGRMKQFHYVYTVVKAWRELLDNFYSHNQGRGDDTALYQVFNRDFTNAFLMGNLSKDVFIDNPRDNSALCFHEVKKRSADEDIRLTKNELHDIRTGIINKVKAKIAALDIGKTPLQIRVSGESSGALKAFVASADKSIAPFEILSESKLAPVTGGTEGLDYESLYQRLESIDESEHALGELECKNLQKGLFLPHKELTSIKKRMLFVLNGSIEEIEPIETPRLEKQKNLKIKPRLSVLISSRAQLELCRESSADSFYQLPSCFPDDYSALVGLFRDNRALTPWFPSVLIGKDYTAAVAILDQVKPKRIVTNNTGIAYEAFKKGIPWVAGPSLNIVNSFSLLCLKEKFNCSGAFLSNEISRKQMMKIITPKDFELYYSIYHPVLLMTSRQCLLHPVEGCGKSIVDDECTLDCNRSSSITSLKNVALFIDKSEGGYHQIYNEYNFLNTDIVNDFPDSFTSFFVDLTTVKTATKVEMNETRIIEMFGDLLNAKPDAKEKLVKAIHPTSYIQYQRGI